MPGDEQFAASSGSTSGVLAQLTVEVLVPGVQSIGTCDMNPMNTSRLSSSDAVTSMKMLILKIILVVVSTMLDELTNMQAGLMAVAMFGVVYYLYDGVSLHEAL